MSLDIGLVDAGKSGPVTKVIRKAGTQSYFAQGEWTSEIGGAQRFEDLVSVMQACSEYQLTGVEIVLMLEGVPSSYDVVLSWPEPKPQAEGGCSEA